MPGAGAGLVRIRVHAKLRPCRAPASALAFGTLGHGRGVRAGVHLSACRDYTASAYSPARADHPLSPHPTQPSDSSASRAECVTVRPDTPTREEARGGCGTCLRAWTLPDPCVCWSGRAQGGGLSCAGVHCERVQQSSSQTPKSADLQKE
eukprot:scaffold48573_cov64-Phaeocystis_antarctica.AAC.3